MYPFLSIEIGLDLKRSGLFSKFAVWKTRVHLILFFFKFKQKISALSFVNTKSSLIIAIWYDLLSFKSREAVSKLQFNFPLSVLIEYILLLLFIRYKLLSCTLRFDLKGTPKFFFQIISRLIMLKAWILPRLSATNNLFLKAIISKSIL